MPQSVGEVEAHFSDRGLTLTPQRRAIVRYLINRGGHPTAAEVLLGITTEFPMASRATVYSTLGLLRDLRVEPPFQVSRFRVVAEGLCSDCA